MCAKWLQRRSRFRDDPRVRGALRTLTQMTELTLPIAGMTCASCVRRIEKALNRVQGVQEASVNLATEKARVLYDPAVADFTALSAAVERAGYGVGPQPETQTSRAAEAPPLD